MYESKENNHCIREEVVALHKSGFKQKQDVTQEKKNKHTRRPSINFLFLNVVVLYLTLVVVILFLGGKVCIVNRLNERNRKVLIG